MEKLLDPRSLAKRYSVSHHTIARWRRQRWIPCHRLGYRTFRFDPEECDQALRRFRIFPRNLR